VLTPIPTEHFEAILYRLSSQQSNVDFLREQGFDTESIEEIRELLRSRGIADTPEELCDAPFRQKSGLQKLRFKTRYSDGSFPVFYASLEYATAKAEIRYWFPRFAGRPSGPRTGFYSQVLCNFDGAVKDVRSRQGEWPNLTHDNDYRFCNALGAEAVEVGLDGLVVPSARRSGGVNVPVFRRQALSNPAILDLVAVTFDPADGSVTIAPSTP
jgi:hypothetical protein